MANTLDKIVTFFRVSPAQQALCLGVTTPATILFTQSAIENYSQGNIIAGVANTLTVLVALGGFLFNEDFAIGKMQEYDKLKKALDEHGWYEKFIEPKSHSWCQRTMAQVASDDAGFGEKTRAYLHEKGYRW